MSNQEFPGLTRCTGTKCSVSYMCIRYTAVRYDDSAIMHPPGYYNTKGDPAIAADPCEFLTKLPEGSPWAEHDEDYSEEVAEAKFKNEAKGYIVQEYDYYKAKIDGTWYHTDAYGELILETAGMVHDVLIPCTSCICFAHSDNECVCGAWDMK